MYWKTFRAFVSEGGYLELFTAASGWQLFLLIVMGIVFVALLAGFSRKWANKALHVIAGIVGILSFVTLCLGLYKTFSSGPIVPAPAPEVKEPIELIEPTAPKKI
ncbi:MAG TPA: hypothetical protein VGO27_22695 [Candidatus Acidoferrum sp.]|jgi:hypothetical protein|nr:hypothetical protein [Candidatus Acidoferrum sp.]